MYQNDLDRTYLYSTDGDHVTKHELEEISLIELNQVTRGRCLH